MVSVMLISIMETCGFTKHIKENSTWSDGNDGNGGNDGNVGNDGNDGSDDSEGNDGNDGSALAMAHLMFDIFQYNLICLGILIILFMYQQVSNKHIES